MLMQNFVKIGLAYWSYANAQGFTYVTPYW